jgi:hypothetical protein
MKEIKLTISEENKEILKQGRIEQNLYFLPNIQLSREKYVEINKVLELCGGKWNRAKKAHIFESEEKANSIIEAQEKGEVIDKKKTYQFFETPKEVVKQMIELADIKTGMGVLEPSAGHGAICDELSKDIELTCIEIDRDKCVILFDKGYKKVHEIDFLEYNGNTFERIIMNPPFTKGQDATHILHAYDLLNEIGTLVAVASASVEFNSQKKYQKLRELIEKNGKIIKLPQNSFKESGTNVNSVLIVLNKLPPQR